MPKIIEFKSFKDNFYVPDILQVDFSKFHYPKNLHLAYHALDLFMGQEKRFPETGNHDDVKKFLQIAADAKNKFDMDEIDEKLLTIFANIGKISIFFG